MLINVWASWCAPCRDEAPALEAFYREHRSADFEILGIDTQETGEGGLGFVDEFGLTYPQLHDGDGHYAKDDLKTTGVPETFLVDPDGDLAAGAARRGHRRVARRAGRADDRGQLTMRRRAGSSRCALVARWRFRRRRPRRPRSPRPPSPTSRTR